MSTVDPDRLSPTSTHEFTSAMPKKGPIAELLGPFGGFAVTGSALFQKVITEQYPREPAHVMPRFHGRHQLNRYPDGLEKCIGCELCAWACPADAIFVEGADNTPDEQYSPGERYGRVYQINYLRCILCGLCIEACPTRALTMTNDFELAGPTRLGLIYDKDEILAPMADGMLAAPHPMVPGTTDDNYYLGEITGPVPEQIEWVREHRPSDPTLETARNPSAPPTAHKPDQFQREKAAKKAAKQAKREAKKAGSK